LTSSRSKIKGGAMLNNDFKGNDEIETYQAGNSYAIFSTLPKSKLKKSLDFIELNIEEQLSLGDLAVEAGMSMFYFARMFKKTTGKSPHQFILEQRIKYAKYLLTQTEEPLVEVALSCGWANQSHFTTAFKRLVGVTPRHYRYWHEPHLSGE
jgi:AraC-like DNA-binding protein